VDGKVSKTVGYLRVVVTINDSFFETELGHCKLCGVDRDFCVEERSGADEVEDLRVQFWRKGVK
jgi:hypothetical protein